MSTHEAKAHRGQYGDPSLWRAVCVCGWSKGAVSQQHADWLAFIHTAQRLAAGVTCSCYFPETGEYDPELYPCPVDRLKEHLASVVAA